MNENNDNTEISEYSNTADILLGIAENQRSQLEQSETLIEQNNTIIEQNNQLLQINTYLFVVLLSLVLGLLFHKVLSVIDSA